MYHLSMVFENENVVYNAVDIGAIRGKPLLRPTDLRNYIDQEYNDANSKTNGKTGYRTFT